MSIFSRRNTETMQHCVVGSVLLFMVSIHSIALAENVRLKTPLGDIVIELLANDAPASVANFKKYITDGDYANTFFHRSVPGFIIQAGGFTFANDAQADVPKDAPIANEPGISNTRGTVAYAKVSGDPDSATSEWFINLDDQNSSNLDAQNGGFTVFARVIGDGMAVADAIAALPRVNVGDPFSNLPVIDFSSGAVTDEHLVFVEITLETETQPGGDDQGNSLSPELLKWFATRKRSLGTDDDQ